MTNPARSLTCVVVADGARARFFAFHPPRARLAAGGVLEERAGLVNAAHRHPGPAGDAHGADSRRAAAGGPGRNDDASEANWRRENDRRFAGQIVDQLLDCCHTWPARQVLLVADKRTLGVLRPRTERLAGLTVREHARDLSRLDGHELLAHLRADGVLGRAMPAAQAMHV